MGTFHGGDRRRSRPCGGPLRPVFNPEHAGHEKPDYKTAALCKQVRRAVALALTGECADPDLQSLIVDDVLPAPNAGRLLVRLLAPQARGHEAVIDLLQRLDHVKGVLRARVAETIARKRTPELTFDVIPVGPAPTEVPDAD
ncbi:MAG: ribosome-binding factor A [Phycisphaerae bacterium]